MTQAATAHLGWYGDDFTGASDTLATLARAGLRSLLFLRIPEAGQLERAARALGGPLEAIGIAGATRSMAPEAIRRELAPVGRFFERIGVPVLHYKVCSTFDSAPEVGSIGAAIEALRPHVEVQAVPVLGGQPSLGRHCVFSHLFAAAGRGGAVERLDRHPTMSVHPSTPMRESDLRLHLALQGTGPVGAVHHTQYAHGAPAVTAAFDAQAAAGEGVVLLDVVRDEDLVAIGQLLKDLAARGRMLVVGASSVAQALVMRAPAAGAGTGAALAPATAPVMAFAGSLSPVTALQVRAAESFHHLALDATALLEPAGLEAACDAICASLAAGQHTLAFTGPASGASTHGPASPAPAAVAAASARLVGRVLQRCAQAGQPLRRLGIAGGDTSSLVTGALGLWGLSYAGQLGPGVAVCRAHADDVSLDGLEIMLKGGQMGATDVFEHLLQGTGLSRPR